MAINFCYQRHRPEINCNKVALDGYEVSNLISENISCRRRGYRGESFISPPVEIVVKFPYSINLSHVVLDLQNASQKTTSFKLYTDVSDEGDNFHLIASHENVMESKLHLYNNRYKASDQFSEFSHSHPPGVKLYPRQDSYVTSVRCFKVLLLKTANSSVPVLSGLELWGQPGIGCSPQLKMEILRTEVNARNSPILPELYNADTCEEDSAKDVDEIPEPPAEFLDALTFELMSQPVLLPSGNNIDRLTLEKYIETSAAWGRLPGDPFTGIPFSKVNEPVSNIELKTRIDNFWFMNPSSCSGGRCIGVTKSVKFYEDNTPPPPVQSCTNRELSQVPNSETSCTKRVLGITTSHSLSCKKPRTVTLKTPHEKELEKSLKESLCSVLKGRPSYLTPTPIIQEISEKCTVCDKNDTSSSEIYSLPCTHLLCRVCLLNAKKSENSVCKICLVTFHSSEALRFHR